jgi:hypothetical protein
MKRLVKVLAFFGVLLLIGALVLSTGKQVKTVWNESDYNSALGKTGIKIEDMNSINVLSLARGTFRTSGRVNVNNSFSSAEVTALIATANKNSGTIKDVNVKFGADNNGEISFKVSDEFIKSIKEEDLLRSFRQRGQVQPQTLEELVLLLLVETASIGAPDGDLTEYTVNLLTSLAANKPIYARGSLERFSANSVTVNIEEVQVGQIKLPQDTLRTIEYYTGLFVTTHIKSENGFSIQELRVVDGQLYYKGTLPAEIKGTQLP